MRGIILLLCLVSIIDLKAQNNESKIKEAIYSFVFNEKVYNDRLNWNNAPQLKSLIYVEPIDCNNDGIGVYFFRVTLNPLRAYLLVIQDEDIIIIGKKDIDMFAEMEDLYDFLLCSEEEKLFFFQCISNKLFFIYRNNLEVENSNRIKVKGESIK